MFILSLLSLRLFKRFSKKIQTWTSFYFSESYDDLQSTKSTQPVSLKFSNRISIITTIFWVD